MRHKSVKDKILTFNKHFNNGFNIAHSVKVCWRITLTAVHASEVLLRTLAGHASENLPLPFNKLKKPKHTTTHNYICRFKRSLLTLNFVFFKLCGPTSCLLQVYELFPYFYGPTNFFRLKSPALTSRSEWTSKEVR